MSENEWRNALLEADIKSLGCAFIAGVGVVRGGWQEVSFLILGIARQQAIALAYTYGQNAIVFVDADGVPELVLTPRPDDVMVFAVQANGRLLSIGFDHVFEDEKWCSEGWGPRNGEEAAFQLLLDCPRSELEAIGISLVDGSSPMNDERYAQLESRVSAANLIAESMAIPLRFRVD